MEINDITITKQVEGVPLTCPFKLERLEDPVIAHCCLTRHPNKTMSLDAVRTCRRRAIHSLDSFNCPYCKVDIRWESFVEPAAISFLLKAVSPDVTRVHLVGEYYCKNNDGTEPIFKTSAGTFWNRILEAETPYKFMQIIPSPLTPEKGFSVFRKETPIVQPSAPDGISIATLRPAYFKNRTFRKARIFPRKNGKTNSWTNPELRRIASDEKIIQERCNIASSRKSSVVRINKRLGDFWEKVQNDYVIEFGVVDDK